MHTLTRLGTCTAAIAAVIFPTATIEIVSAAAEGGTTVVLDGALRRCDFSRVTEAAMVPRPEMGTGSALIHTSGSSAVAEGARHDPQRAGRPLRRRPDRGAPSLFGHLRSRGSGHRLYRNEHRRGRQRNGNRPRAHSAGHDGRLGDYRAPERKLPKPGRVLHVRIPGAGIGRSSYSVEVSSRPYAVPVRRPAVVRPR